MILIMINLLLLNKIIVLLNFLKFINLYYF